MALLPTLPLWTIVSLRKFILYFNIFVNYSYCSRRVVLVHIPLTTRRRSLPPPPDFLTSYLEKTALANWTGLYLYLYLCFFFTFVFVFVFVSSPPLDSTSSFLENRHFAPALLYLHPSIVRLGNYWFVRSQLASPSALQWTCGWKQFEHCFDDLFLTSKGKT